MSAPPWWTISSPANASGSLSGGGVSERPKENASKAFVGASPPRVQIPPPPPLPHNPALAACDHGRVDRADIEDAARRIRGHVRRTPVQVVDAGDPWLPAGGWLKLELLQHTGTFKPRGAFNRILCARERGELDPAVGIVVASGGNAGLANAYAAASVGVPATVFVPTTSSPTKVRRLHEYGARVEQRGIE